MVVLVYVFVFLFRVIITKKNNYIEFFRFVSAIIILFFHIHRHLIELRPINVFGLHLQPFAHGWIGVDFFFILTGFFLARQAKKDIISDKSISKASYHMLKVKFIKILPCHIYTFVICFALKVLLEKVSFYNSFLLFRNSIPTLLLIYYTGLKYIEIVPNEWYLSCVMIAIAIVYPILIKCYDFIRSYFLLAPLLLYGYMLAEHNYIKHNGFWTGLTYHGVLRSIAGILLGCLAYELFLYFGKISLSRRQKILVALLELLGYVSLLVYSSIPTTESEAVHVAFLVALSVSITFSDKTVLSKFFSHNFFAFLGELSFPIYLTQGIGYLICEYMIKRGMISKCYEIVLLNVFITFSFSLIFVFLKRYYISKKKNPKPDPAR